MLFRSILYANQRFTDLFGASGKSRMRENEAGLSAAWEPAHVVIANGISSDPSNGEFQHRASKRWYHVNENSIRWIDGRMVSLKVATDITEAKRAQELNLRRQTKLQANSRLMTAGGMASVLAHELNQPLTAISIYSRHCVQLLSPGHADTAGLRDTLEKCHAQAMRASAIIGSIRGLARKHDPTLESRDINAIITGTLALVQPELKQGGVELTLLLGRALPKVRADVIMIEQLLINLIRNAVEAMQQHQAIDRRLAIESAPADAGMLRVSVRDSGSGIPAGVEANMNTPFFSTKPDGMGIGLNICRSIVELHGGGLWHESSPTGCTFSFTLSIAKP